MQISISKINPVNGAQCSWLGMESWLRLLVVTRLNGQSEAPCQRVASWMCHSPPLLCFFREQELYVTVIPCLRSTSFDNFWSQSQVKLRQVCISPLTHEQWGCRQVSRKLFKQLCRLARFEDRSLELLCHWMWNAEQKTTLDWQPNCVASLKIWIWIYLIL